MVNAWKNTMLVSPRKIKDSGLLSLNVDDAYIGAAIRTAQMVHLVDAIGTDLVEKLQLLVYNKVNNVSGATNIDSEENIQYKVLLDEYVTPALISKTIVESALRMSLKIRNMGVVRNSDTNVNYAQLADIKYLMSYEETDYNHYLNRMAEFLCDNKEAFPESNYDCGCMPKKKFANIQIWLGDGKKGCCK